VVITKRRKAKPEMTGELVRYRSSTMSQLSFLALPCDDTGYRHGADHDEDLRFPAQLFFEADLIAGSPNATHCAIKASTQMYHGMAS